MLQSVDKINNYRTMTSEVYNLNGIQNSFKKLQADKKKSTLKALELILELNKSVGFDEILVREGFEAYQKRNQIVKNKSLKSYQDFFKHMLDHLDTIQENYLRQSNDKEFIEKASKQNPKEYNFLLNKNSVSKFIRDQASHYQNVVDTYLEDLGIQQEKGIKSTKLHKLFVDLFKNKYTNIIRNNSLLLEEGNAELAVNIGNCLLNYGKKVKQMTPEQAQSQFIINQQEILDFLTFWLKSQSQSNLFVLYARTKQRLDQQSKILLNKSIVQATMHPSRMTKTEIDHINKQQSQNPKQIQQLPTEQPQLQPQNKIQKLDNEVEQIKEEVKQIENIESINMSHSKVQEQLSPQKKQCKKKQFSKQQLLKRQLQDIFQFGCKRKYNLHKNTTFDELQNQRKTMNFQKFMNFCTFFQLTSIISKELIAEYFKINAINLRLIDFYRFQQIINKMVKTDLRIADNLLSMTRFQVQRKQNQIQKNKKGEGKLSSYHFKLRPVNGKDISTIERQFQYKRLQKQIQREQRDHKALIKREYAEQPRLNLRSKSNMLHTKVNSSDLQPIRDIRFNPQSLILQSAQDNLWDAYQAKIWKKQDKNQKSVLESILSKRINRGNEIISKINSQRQFLYQ